jgi:hypothetical protein
MKKILVFTLFVVFLFSNSLFSQTKRKIGLSGSIQSSQFGISLPIWLSEKFVLAPAFDFEFVEKVGTDLSIGLAPRFYLKNDKLAPYFGLKLGMAINIPSSNNTIDTKTKFDIMGGLAFGAEYFIGDNFSLGVEAQGNFTKSDKNSNRFGNPDGLNFNTATMLSATIYF